MKDWSKIAAWGLVGIMAVNIAGAAYFIVLQRQMRGARPQATLSDDTRFPVLSGIDVRGVSWVASNSPCHVIRIADDHCSYCKKDKPSYDQIVKEARASSCEVIEISPQAGGLAYDPRPGIVQLKFVDADIGSVLFPFVTPQTVILDKNWTVKMTRRGVFTDQALASSVALLGKLGDHRSAE